MNLFASTLLKTVRLYAIVVVLNCAVILATCLWVALYNTDYGIFEPLRPQLALPAFLFHTWLVWATDRALEGKSTRKLITGISDGQHTPNKYRNNSHA